MVILGLRGINKRWNMKEGRTLKEIASELERQTKVRKDYLASSEYLEMAVAKTEDNINGMVLNGIGDVSMGITDYAHGQFAERLSIPKKYYDRMMYKDPELLVHNVNTWLHKEPDKRMVRTLDNNVRAFLSSSYRPLDNYDLAETAFPILHEKGCEVVSSELTETRMYVKAILPSLTAEILGSRQKNDVVQAGIVISNSEVGAGSVKIEPMIYRLVCTNGMIALDSSLRKYHVGKSTDVEGVRELLTNEAREADDRAFWLKVRDVLRGSFDQDIFFNLVEKMELAAKDEIKSRNLMKVVEVTANRFTLPEQQKNSILTHLIQGNDLSKWGLVNAVTRTANDEKSYEMATELERTGGKILELAPMDWRQIAEAA